MVEKMVLMTGFEMADQMVFGLVGVMVGPMVEKRAVG